MTLYDEISIRQWVRYLLGQTSIGIRMYPQDILKRKDVMEIVKDELNLLKKTRAITVFDEEEAVKDVLRLMEGEENDKRRNA